MPSEAFHDILHFPEYVTICYFCWMIGELIQMVAP
jgi:hypothetical protein